MGRFKQLLSKCSTKIPGRYTQAPRYAHSNTLCVAVNGQDNLGPDSPQLAIQSCREAINVLNKQELSLQSQMHIAETEARALLRLGDRGGAETSLKKREIVLREIDRLHKTRMSLLSQILLVETATTRQVAVEALASGVSAHRRMSQRMFQDTQVQQLQDALIEQATFETEISELLGQGFDAIANFDDETNLNLKRSLAELEQDEVANAMADAPYQGMCSAESYQGTNNSTYRNPCAISFPPDTKPFLIEEADDEVQRLINMSVLNESELNDRAGGALMSSLMTTMSSPTAARSGAGTELKKWQVSPEPAPMNVEQL